MTGPQMPRFTGHLEPEHIALTNQLIEHWMGVGLSTERVDRDAAEQAVTAAPGVHRLVDVAFRWGGWVGGCSCGHWWWSDEPTRAELAAAHREVHVEAVTVAVAS